MKNRSIVQRSVAAFTAAGVCSGFALAGPDWVEGKNDAGSFVSTAQRTLGVGQLLAISGQLSAAFGLTGAGGDYEDMFLITVTDPSKFQITVASANFNAQLFIFNVTLPGQAFGLLANRETVFGDAPVLTPVATDGSGAALTVPGQYAIAISGYGRNPVSNTGAIFNFGSPFEVSGPDGPGGFNPHNAWVGEGEVGSYTLHLDGVGFYDVPGPGAFALLGLAGLRRTRRRPR